MFLTVTLLSALALSSQAASTQGRRYSYEPSAGPNQPVAYNSQTPSSNAGSFGEGYAYENFNPNPGFLYDGDNVNNFNDLSDPTNGFYYNQGFAAPNFGSDPLLPITPNTFYSPFDPTPILSNLASPYQYYIPGPDNAPPFAQNIPNGNSQFSSSGTVGSPANNFGGQLTPYPIQYYPNFYPPNTFGASFSPFNPSISSDLPLPYTSLRGKKPIPTSLPVPLTSSSDNDIPITIPVLLNNFASNSEESSESVANNANYVLLPQYDFVETSDGINGIVNTETSEAIFVPSSELLPSNVILENNITPLIFTPVTTFSTENNAGGNIPSAISDTDGSTPSSSTSQISSEPTSSISDTVASSAELSASNEPENIITPIPSSVVPTSSENLNNGSPGNLSSGTSNVINSVSSSAPMNAIGNSIAPTAPTSASIPSPQPLTVNNSDAINSSVSAETSQTNLAPSLALPPSNVILENNITPLISTSGTTSSTENNAGSNIPPSISTTASNYSGNNYTDSKPSGSTPQINSVPASAISDIVLISTAPSASNAPENNITPIPSSVVPKNSENLNNGSSGNSPSGTANVINSVSSPVQTNTIGNSIAPTAPTSAIIPSLKPLTVNNSDAINSRVNNITPIPSSVVPKNSENLNNGSSGNSSSGTANAINSVSSSTPTNAIENSVTSTAPTPPTSPSPQSVSVKNTDAINSNVNTETSQSTISATASNYSGNTYTDAKPSGSTPQINSVPPSPISDIVLNSTAPSASNAPENNITPKPSSVVPKNSENLNNVSPGNSSSATANVINSVSSSAPTNAIGNSIAPTAPTSPTNPSLTEKNSIVTTETSQTNFAPSSALPPSNIILENNITPSQFTPVTTSSTENSAGSNVPSSISDTTSNYSGNTYTDAKPSGATPQINSVPASPIADIVLNSTAPSASNASENNTTPLSSVVPKNSENFSNDSSGNSSSGIANAINSVSSSTPTNAIGNSVTSTAPTPPTSPSPQSVSVKNSDGINSNVNTETSQSTISATASNYSGNTYTDSKPTGSTSQISSVPASSISDIILNSTVPSASNAPENNITPISSSVVPKNSENLNNGSSGNSSSGTAVIINSVSSPVQTNAIGNSITPTAPTSTTSPSSQPLTEKNSIVTTETSQTNFAPSSALSQSNIIIENNITPSIFTPATTSSTENKAVSNIPASISATASNYSGNTYTDSKPSGSTPQINSVPTSPISDIVLNSTAPSASNAPENNITPPSSVVPKNSENLSNDSSGNSPSVTANAINSVFSPAQTNTNGNSIAPTAPTSAIIPSRQPPTVNNSDAINSSVNAETSQTNFAPSSALPSSNVVLENNKTPSIFTPVTTSSTENKAGSNIPSSISDTASNSGNTDSKPSGSTPQINSVPASPILDIVLNSTAPSASNAPVNNITPIPSSVVPKNSENLNNDSSGNSSSGTANAINSVSSSTPTNAIENSVTSTAPTPPTSPSPQSVSVKNSDGINSNVNTETSQSTISATASNYSGNTYTDSKPTGSTSQISSVPASSISDIILNSTAPSASNAPENNITPISSSVVPKNSENLNNGSSGNSSSGTAVIINSVSSPAQTNTFGNSIAPTAPTPLIDISAIAPSPLTYPGTNNLKSPPQDEPKDLANPTHGPSTTGVTSPANTVTTYATSNAPENNIALKSPDVSNNSANPNSGLTASTPSSSKSSYISSEAGTSLSESIPSIADSADNVFSQLESGDDFGESCKTIDFDVSMPIPENNPFQISMDVSLTALIPEIDESVAKTTSTSPTTDPQSYISPGAQDTKVTSSVVSSKDSVVTSKVTKTSGPPGPVCLCFKNYKAMPDYIKNIVLPIYM